jgi:signal peptidase I
VRRLIRETLLPVMVVLTLALAIQGAVAKPYVIPTGSMLPTIELNDRIVVNRIVYRLRDIDRGDIVVFTPPAPALDTCSVPDGDVPFVKRVIGVPGDRVEVRENGPTLVNGRVLVTKNARKNNYSRVFEPVPPGHILVLGDNRAESCDSHQWESTPPRPESDPFVPEENIIGQAEFIYWPPNRARVLG